MNKFPTKLQHQISHNSISSPEVLPEGTNPKLRRHLSNGSDLTILAGYDYVMKIILLGDQGVGKTSFMKALKFHPDVTKVQCSCRVAAFSDHLEVEVPICHGKTAFIKLYDTGGQERYRSLTSSYYRGAHGVFLMCDVTNKRSMENIGTWMSDLDAFSSSSSCVRVLLGTKCTAKNREVTPFLARKYAESQGLPYMELDTAHFYNVVESLHLIAEIIAREVTISSLNSIVIKPSMGSQEKASCAERTGFCLC